MKLIKRESEIKAAGMEACPNDGCQGKINLRVDWFIKGAKWADEHPEGKWRDASEPPKTHIDVLVSDGVDYAIGHYNHDFGEWCISSRDVRNVERWMPLPYIPWIE
jgi:hypothetical protein